MQAAVHMIVTGLVQGVGFRWYVARHAQALGLRGYVANLYDGTVEIEAAGERALLEQLIKEVKVGPRSAHVTDLRLDWRNSAPEKETTQLTHFEIR
jgi:acylphosphatase